MTHPPGVLSSNKMKKAKGQPDGRFRRAIRYLNLGREAEATAILLPLARQGPAAHRLQAHAALCRLVAQRGDAEGAVSHARAAAAAQPHRPIGYILLGRALYDAGRFEESVAALRHGVSLQEPDGEPFPSKPADIVRALTTGALALERQGLTAESFQWGAAAQALQHALAGPDSTPRAPR